MAGARTTDFLFSTGIRMVFRHWVPRARFGHRPRRPRLERLGMLHRQARVLPGLEAPTSGRTDLKPSDAAAVGRVWRPRLRPGSRNTRRPWSRRPSR